MAACMEKALNMGTVELTKFLTEVYNKGYIGTDLTFAGNEYSCRLRKQYES